MCVCICGGGVGCGYVGCVCGGVCGGVGGCGVCVLFCLVLFCFFDIHVGSTFFCVKCCTV